MDHIYHCDLQKQSSHEICFSSCMFFMEEERMIQAALGPCQEKVRYK